MPEEREYNKDYTAMLKSVPWVTLILIAINVAVFFFTEAKGSTLDTEYMIKMGAAYEPLIIDGHEFYRLITHFFLHFGWDHLFNNMISLLVLGYATELVLGRVRFFCLYFLSGVGAGVASLVYNMMGSADPSVSAGASGAIFGLSGALLILVIRGNRGRRSTEVIRYLIYMALSLYSGFVDPSIDHMAHLGGFIFGALLCFLMTLGKKRMKVTYS